MLNGKKKRTKKNCQKILNFTILLTTLVETLPKSMHEFWGANMQISFETFTPIWSHVNENEKKNVKNKKFEISQFCEYFGRDLP